MANTVLAKNILAIFGLVGLIGWYSSPSCLVAQSSLQYHLLAPSYGGHAGSFLMDNFALSQHGQLITKQADIVATYRSAEITMPQSDTSVYRTVALEIEATPFESQSMGIMLEFLLPNQQWVSADHLSYCPVLTQDDQPEIWFSQQIQVPAEATVLRYTIFVSARGIGATPMVLSPLKLHISHVKDPRPLNPHGLKNRLSGDASSTCSHPGYYDRAAWYAPDPDTQAYTCLQPQYASISHCVVTQSNTSNESRNWPAEVLSLYSYHVNVLGKCDIGYNWIIDPEGVIYEARGGGLNVVGDYLSGDPKAEVGTTGICLLGTFGKTADPNPSPEQVNSLKKLLAWQMVQSGIDPLQTQNTISGLSNIPVITNGTDFTGDPCSGSVLVNSAFRSEVVDQVTQCLNATSIQPAEAISDVNIFPNPSNGSFQIAFELPTPQEVSFEVFDLSGKRVWHDNFYLNSGPQQRRIQLPVLSDGIYYLKSIAGHTVNTQIISVRN